MDDLEAEFEEILDRHDLPGDLVDRIRENARPLFDRWAEQDTRDGQLAPRLDRVRTRE